jgi:peptidase M50B-like protein
LKRIHIFVLAVVLSLVLMYFSYLPAIGVLGQVLILFSTLFHELGHGLMAMLVGGEFKQVVINWDGSGVTNSMISDSRLARGLVAAGGLIGPSIAAALLFWAARSKDAKFLLATRLFALALLVLGVLTARSVWALVFTVGLGAVLLVLSGKVSRKALESLVVFIGVQLGLSVFTRADYLFTRTASGLNMPSDVAQMSEALFLPFWFWGLVCGLFSVVVLFWGCRCYVEE